MAFDGERKLMGQNSGQMNDGLRNNQPKQAYPSDGGMSVDADREPDEYQTPQVEFMSWDDYWNRMYGEDD